MSYTIKGLIPNKGTAIARAKTQVEAFEAADELLQAGAMTIVIVPPAKVELRVISGGRVSAREAIATVEQFHEAYPALRVIYPKTNAKAPVRIEDVLAQSEILEAAPVADRPLKFGQMPWEVEAPSSSLLPLSIEESIAMYQRMQAEGEAARALEAGGDPVAEAVLADPEPEPTPEDVFPFSKVEKMDHADIQYWLGKLWDGGGTRMQISREMFPTRISFVTHQDKVPLAYARTQLRQCWNIALGLEP